MRYEYFSRKKSKENTLKAVVFLKIRAQSAASGPPVGAILGQFGIPAAPFCKLFNDRTKQFKSDTIIHVTLFLGLNGEYIINISPPSIAFFTKKAIGSDKLYRYPVSKKFFLSIKPAQVLTRYMAYEIVLYKQSLNFINHSSTFFNLKQFVGSFRSMGIIAVT